LSLWAQITFIFFFQAEDGIRVFHVTGVQTCALPISAHRAPSQSVSELGVCIRIIRGVARGHSARSPCPETGAEREYAMELNSKQIGRASCRERVYISEFAVAQKSKEKK